MCTMRNWLFAAGSMISTSGAVVGSGVQGLVRGSVWSGSAVPFGSCGPCSLLIFAAAICVQLESELLRVEKTIHLSDRSVVSDSAAKTLCLSPLVRRPS